MKREDLLEEYIDCNHAVHKLLKARFYRAIENSGLSPALISILYTVSRMQPASGVDIAKETHITRGAVAQFVDVLYENGLVEKSIDQNDRRITYISLTAKGKKLINKFKNTRNKIIAQLTKDLSDDELRQVIAVINKILNQAER